MIATPLERAQTRVIEEKFKLACTQRVIKVLAPLTTFTPWLVNPGRHNGHSRQITVIFRVKTLAEVKQLAETLVPVPSLIDSPHPIRLEVGYPCGMYTQNKWSWRWQNNGQQCYDIQVECAEIVGRATADKKIKYFYSPDYKFEFDKFNLNQNSGAIKRFGTGGYSFGSEERSEHAPSFTLTWPELLSPFK